MKVLFVYTGLFTFIKLDQEILEKHYKVYPFGFDASHKIFTPISFIRQLFYLLRYGWSADVIVCDFAGYNSYLPAIWGKIFGKPVFMILCGTECYSIPGISYGNFNKTLQGWFTGESLKMADYLLPVHKRLVDTEYNYAPEGAPRQGYRHFCPKATAPVVELNYGYDFNLFYPEDVERTNASFLTVASHTVGSTYYRKGVDIILEIAAKRPDCNFTIVGRGPKLDSAELPSNVKVYERVTQDKLRGLYSSHEFYFQLSMAEGFPNALCEAMLCGAIPIGSDVAAIPDIIGDTGFVLPKKDVNLLSGLMDAALKCDKKKLSEAAVERIRTKWPLERREQILIGKIKEVTVD